MLLKIEQKIIKKILLTFCILSIVMLFFTVFININNYLSFINSYTKNTDLLEIEIKKGQNISDIFEELTQQKIIHEEQIFGVPAYKIYIFLEPQFKKNIIKAGKHTIPPNTKVNELINIFSKSTYCEEIKITIPEGLRIEEIASIYENSFLNNKAIKFDKNKFIYKARNYDHRQYYNETSVIKYPKNLEGYLFPDTYSFCIEEVSEEKIIKTMLSNFEKKVMQLFESSKNKSNLSIEEIINLASILERESRKNDERKIVAGILIKRLEINMPLGVDATSQYGFGYSEKEKSWWPKGEDLLLAIEQNNPYNTRKVLGLPPTPISNPGLDSIKAVIEYEKTDYLYYLHDDCGNIHYSKTLLEHNQKTIKYIGTGCKR